MRAEVLRELQRSRTPVDRLRARATAAAAAGIGVAALAASSIGGLGTGDVTSIALPSSSGTGTETVTAFGFGGSGGLAPFLAQAGLRPGAVLAAVLLVVPFVALAAQAVRVGSLALEREAAQLAVAGATPADLRRLRGSRAARAFGIGALLAGPSYLLLWLLLGRVLPLGSRLLPEPQVWLLLVWVAVGAALYLLGGLVGGRRRSAPAPLVRTTAPDRPPSAALVWSSGAAAVLLLTVASQLDGVTGSSALVAVVLLVEALLLLTFVSGLVARRAARAPSGAQELGRLRPGRARRRIVSGRLARDPAVAVLAAAQRRSSPRAAGAVAGVLFVCGTSFGVEAVLITDALTPEQGFGQSDLAFYVGGALLAAVVGLTAAVVALLALALSLTDHLLGARRAVASTAALGADLRRLVAVQRRALTTTAVPATAAGALLAGLLFAPLLVGSPLSGLRAVGVALGAALLSSVLVALACRAVAALLSGRVRSAAALENLRTP